METSLTDLTGFKGHPLLCYLTWLAPFTALRVPTLHGKPLKPGILSFTFPGLENAWNLSKKWENPGILTQTLEKLYISKFGVSKFTFQDVIYKINSVVHLCHIYIINTNTVIQSQIDLEFYWFYLDNLENNGISCNDRSGKSWYMYSETWQVRPLWWETDLHWETTVAVTWPYISIHLYLQWKTPFYGPIGWSLVAGFTIHLMYHICCFLSCNLKSSNGYFSSQI